MYVYVSLYAEGLVDVYKIKFIYTYMYTVCVCVVSIFSLWEIQ